MKYLEAINVIKNVQYKDAKTLKIFTSCSIEQISIFLKAKFALKETDIDIEISRFGSLIQSLIQDIKSTDYEIAILFPWDIAPETDWRTGGPIEKRELVNNLNIDNIRISSLIQNRNLDLVLFCDFPILPFMLNLKDRNNYKFEIKKISMTISNNFIHSDFFSLKNYLNTGLPFKVETLYKIANKIVDQISKIKLENKKLIISDLDNTLWKGVLGEDNLEGIDASPNGLSYTHFIYQKTLKRLKEAGILLCIVSKNDIDLVNLAFTKKTFELEVNDFVMIKASYEPKYKHVEEISKTLNLGFESMIFIDDNEIEIAQLSQKYQNIKCLKYPNNPDDFYDFIENLMSQFYIDTLTQEDKTRTELYRSRSKNFKKIESSVDIDINDFLLSLDMKLTIQNKNDTNYDRGLQLINKTNQFNQNGNRITETQFKDIIESGGLFFTGQLSDKSGSHGEVIALLITCRDEIFSYVMSCRVFDRKLEYVFLLNILKYTKKDLTFDFVKTERNTPFRFFINNVINNNNLKKKVTYIDLKTMFNKFDNIFQTDFKEEK